jgi:hypothetical protein
MTDEPQVNEDQKDRDRKRSDEAHWRVAEEGAEDQANEPKQTTKRRLEIPVPEREDFMRSLKKVGKSK